MIDQYNPQNGSFIIGGKRIKIRPTDVSLMFGIINGDEEINHSYTQRVESEFVTRRFDGEKEIKISSIKNAVTVAAAGNSRDDVQDVARLLCLLLCGSLFFASSGERVKWGFVYYVQDLDRMREYNWCKAILDELLGSMGKANNDSSKVTGCTTLLQVKIFYAIFVTSN